MGELQTFAPGYLIEQAKMNGFFQCPDCGLVWFGKPESEVCPDDAYHGEPVHVAVLDRNHDGLISADLIIQYTR